MVFGKPGKSARVVLNRSHQWKGHYRDAIGCARLSDYARRKLAPMADKLVLVTCIA